MRCIDRLLAAARWAELPQSVSHTRCLAASGPGCARRNARWSLHRLTFVLLALTWCTGDSIPECFETARAWYVACYQCRKRPGIAAWLSQSLDRRAGTCPHAVSGCGRASPHFHALRRPLALSRLSSLRLRWLAHGMSALPNWSNAWERPAKRFGAHAVADGHRPSPLRLAVGVAPGQRHRQRRRMHLIHLLATLPARSLLVTDAGYIGYELLVAMTTAKVRHTDPDVVARDHSSPRIASL